MFRALRRLPVDGVEWLRHVNESYVKILVFGPHPGLAGYLVMIFLDAAESTDWCVLSSQFLGSGAVRSALSVVAEWQRHPSEVSHPGIGEECGYMNPIHRGEPLLRGRSCAYHTDQQEKRREILGGWLGYMNLRGFDVVFLLVRFCLRLRRLEARRMFMIDRTRR